MVSKAIEVTLEKEEIEVSFFEEERIEATEKKDFGEERVEVTFWEKKRTKRSHYFERNKAMQHEADYR